MSTCIALLRGVNVGGKNLLPMKVLAQMFVDAGCGGVRTYIQSGNVIFTAPEEVMTGLPQRITAGIAGCLGCNIPVIFRKAEELGKVLSNNPFLKAGVDEKMLHVMFLASEPDKASLAQLDPHRSPPDAFVVRNREIYLQLPNGGARSKLTNAYFDSRLATVSTVRNWRTVRKLFEMANSV